MDPFLTTSIHNVPPSTVGTAGLSRDRPTVITAIMVETNNTYRVRRRNRNLLADFLCISIYRLIAIVVPNEFRWGKNLCNPKKCMFSTTRVHNCPILRNLRPKTDTGLVTVDIWKLSQDTLRLDFIRLSERQPQTGPTSRSILAVLKLEVTAMRLCNLTTQCQANS